VTQLGWLRLVRGSMVVALCASVLAGTATGQAQSLPGADWSPAAGAVGDNTYQGFIDRPSAGASMPAGTAFPVSGWVFDNTAQGWSGIDDVQVMLGGTSLGHLSVGQSRPDVAGFLNNPNAATSGFSGTISSSLPTGNQTLTIVAHTPDKGSWSKNVPVIVTGGAGGTITNAPAAASSGLVLRIISPSSSDVVPSNNNGTIYGVAYDTRTRPELGSGVDRVSAYLDGPRGTAGSQSLGDATFNGTNWSITWQPTHYNKERHHILWVYARSAVTGEETLLQQEINLSS
jgi:Bacterial Ig domain